MKFLDERIARTPGHKLRELLKSGQLILGGGAHDALSARIVQEVGYPLCVVTGAGVSMCRGYPDVGFVTLEEMVANARYIAEAVRIPVVVDADNGYGNALNVMRTVREFERAGVAGIHIEDQVWPKRCGHMVGKRLIAKEEMAGKIRAALDARRDEDFVKLQQVQVETLTKALLASEQILEVAPLPSLMTPRQLSIPGFREAAVRMQADLLLVFRIGSDTYSQYRAFAKDKVKSYSTCELVLLDVRTGLVPFAKVVSREQMEVKKSTDMDLAETMRRAEQASAVDALKVAAEELVGFVKSVPRKAG